MQGVIHSGGVLADASLQNQTAHGVRTSFAPKVSSAKLWEGTATMQPASVHIAFSSVAALIGSGGQTNYCMANAVLDVAVQVWQQQVGCKIKFLQF